MILQEPQNRSTLLREIHPEIITIFTYKKTINQTDD